MFKPDTDPEADQNRGCRSPTKSNDGRNKEEPETSVQETNTTTAVDLHELVDERMKKYNSAFSVERDGRRRAG